MEKELKEYIKNLDEYKKVHHFKYSDIADMIGTTTRSIRRWIRNEYIPLPIYQRAIIDLVKNKNSSRR